MIKRAVVSVYDKRGIEEFCRELVRHGVEIISTGGTYKRLGEAQVPVTYISDVTGFPEVLDGRVKTLHPRVHAGILARRENPSDMRQLEAEGIEPIDMVVVNLYPFEETVRRPGVTFDECMENIDIGGPTLIRAAAKNHRYVTVVVRPARYGEIVDRLGKGALDAAFRMRLAEEAFAHTAAYDAAIRDFFAARIGAGEKEAGRS